MALVKLNEDKLLHNYKKLDKIFQEKNIEWGVVTKLLCGTSLYLEKLIEIGVREMHDTRLSNIRRIKKLCPDVQTVYIKPPAKRNVPKIIKYADVSFNTEFSTIRLLSDEAVLQDKIHKVIIMVEMGDLREGVMGEKLIDFYSKVFELPNITIIGLGTNFNCLNGILPNKEKLEQLCQYKTTIETKFGQHIPWVSGGTSVTLSLLLQGQIPPEVNHFRIGEALFFGNDLISGDTFEGFHTDIFTLYAQIIELREKPVVPDGEQIENVAGFIPEFQEEDKDKKTVRAILDLGLLDVKTEFIMPEDENIQIIEASSDMLVMDLGDNKQHYKTGDFISFKLRYMGALSLMNSFYIEKIIG